MTSRQIQAVRGGIAAGGGLVNAAGLAVVWGVSRQRAAQLVGSDSFPEPVGDVGGRPVWLLEQCQRWRGDRGTKPGPRPRDDR